MASLCQDMTLHFNGFVKVEEKWKNNKLINQTLNVSLFCTGKCKHSCSVHRPRKLGRYQWTRACISQYKTAARVVFE